MKKIFGFLAAFVFCAGIVCGTGYLALNEYFQDTFKVNTWINGIYCTGKTVAEINEELVNLHEASVVTIADADCAYWEIDMKEAGICPDYTAWLEEYRKETAKETTAFSLQDFQEPSDIKLEIPKYVYDEEKLRECFYELEFVKQEKEKAYGVKVLAVEETNPAEMFSENLLGNSSENISESSVWYDYVLLDGNKGRLNLEKAYAALLDALDNGKISISLMDAGCYEDIPDSQSDLEQRELFEKINAFSDSKLVYDMGAELLEITPGLARSFLVKDEETLLPVLNEAGSLAINENAVFEWVDSLAAQYNTVGTEREFMATRGDLVTVKYVTYGTELDSDAEKNYLLHALEEERSETEYHIPAYTKEGYARGMDDIGDTYVEIDLTNQKMYYYESGELLLETDVVTGNLSKGWGTPEGINKVYYKSRKVVLRGADYESFVEYWMAVKGGIGIHDASWRYKFGGEIYKKNGSHGCINTPSEIMDEFYESVKLGTPVIMFY